MILGSRLRYVGASRAAAAAHACPTISRFCPLLDAAQQLRLATARYAGPIWRQDVAPSVGLRKRAKALADSVEDYDRNQDEGKGSCRVAGARAAGAHLKKDALVACRMSVLAWIHHAKFRQGSDGGICTFFTPPRSALRNALLTSTVPTRYPREHSCAVASPVVPIRHGSDFVVRYSVLAACSAGLRPRCSHRAGSPEFGVASAWHAHASLPRILGRSLPPHCFRYIFLLRLMRPAPSSIP